VFSFPCLPCFPWFLFFVSRSAAAEQEQKRDRENVGFQKRGFHKGCAHFVETSPAGAGTPTFCASPAKAGTPRTSDGLKPALRTGMMGQGPSYDELSDAFYGTHGLKPALPTHYRGQSTPFQPGSQNQSPILNPQSPILNPQSSIRNPQSPIPNPQSSIGAVSFHCLTFETPL
jgi:hypothetical protein